MGCGKSSAEREVHSNTSLPQKKKKKRKKEKKQERHQINNLILQVKQLGKE